MWAVLKNPAAFRLAYRVTRDAKSFGDLAEEMGGSREHQVKINRLPTRGVTFRLDYLPLEVVAEVIRMVNIHWRRENLKSISLNCIQYI